MKKTEAQLSFHDNKMHKLISKILIEEAAHIQMGSRSGAYHRQQSNAIRTGEFPDSELLCQGSQERTAFWKITFHRLTYVFDNEIGLLGYRQGTHG